jgi:putative transposase
MAKKGYTPEQIINKLREAEIMFSQGATLTITLKKIGLSTLPTTASVKNMAA